MDAAQYKCPNCNAELKFDPTTQKLSCDYCLSAFTIDEIKQLYSEQENVLPQEEQQAQIDAAKQTIIDSGAEVYIPTEEELKAFQDACQPVYQQMVDEGICTQAEMDEMLAIVAAAK